MTETDHPDDPPRPRATPANDAGRTDGDAAESAIWASGDAYEPYVGRWSRIVAREFVAWLAAPPNERWLDVGCGTGALTETILERAAPQRVVGVDPSAEFLGYARSRLRDPRCDFVVGDVFTVPAADGFDAVVSGLALNFMPEPAAAVAEMARLTRPDGIVAAYVWDYAGEMQLMRHFWSAAAELDVAARALDEGPRFAAVCHPARLLELWTGANLEAVDTRAIDIETRFRDFDDYWQPFLGGQGPAPAYLASRSPDRQAALRERIRARLPTAADGSIALLARAWAVRGRRGASGS